MAGVRSISLGRLPVALVLVLLTGTGAWADASGGGTQRWSASYRFGTSAFSTATALSPDGSTVFVTGTTPLAVGSTRGRFTTLAYDASTGAERWVANYPGGSSPETGQGTALAVSPDGSTLFVTGSSVCPSSSCGDLAFRGYSTVAYDAATGTREWVARYGTEGGARSIGVSPDGSTLFVNGSAELGGSATVAYDPSTGDQLWAVESDDRAPPLPGALSASSDSSMVYVVGTAEVPGACTSNTGVHTTAYDAADGTVRWSSYHQMASDDFCGTATDVGMSPDGSKVFVTGYGGLSDGSSTYGTGILAYDALAGTELWARHNDDIRVFDGDIAIPLGVSPDGSKVFVLSNDCDSPCPRKPFVTVAHDVATGDRLWESRYDGGGRGFANDLGVSPDGSAVFVTGQETLPCFDPCQVPQVNAPLVAYDAGTGNERWATTYADNVATALAVSPDGSSVYLAGSFTASASTQRVGARSGRTTATSCSDTCGYSTAGYNIGPGPGRVQDADHPVRYNGWRTVFHKTAVGGAYRASQVGGATATFRTPKVRSVKWLTHLGPDQGKARVFIDGRPKGTFNLYDPTAGARSFTFDGLARRAHTVKVKVLGTKATASTGTWVAVDGFEVRVGIPIRQESSPRIRYDSWAGETRSAASGRSYRESNSPTARISLDFTGRTVRWITATGPAYGRARVVIDGKAHTVDLYRRTRNWRVPITFTGLSRGEHRLTVRPLGRKNASSTSTNVVVDAFVVRS
jgi:PQQ-like domain